MTRIPFENLDVLLGRGFARSRQRLGQARGCSARRLLLRARDAVLAALEPIGFRPRRQAAPWCSSHARRSMRPHMFLSVPLPEGRFLVDPGFGALVPRLPLPLVEGAHSRPIGATHWMARDGAFWALRTTRDGGEVDVWLSTLEEENPADFEVANHYTATHPASPFVNRIMLRAFAADGAVTVMNRDVTLWHGESAESTQLADRGALRGLLRGRFGFDLPEIEKVLVPAIPEWR